MSNSNTVFKLVGETVDIADRETSILNLVATTLRQLIMEDKIRTMTAREEYFDLESIIDVANDMANIRALEIVKHDRVLNYHSDLEAFTCEISGSRAYILKHKDIDTALRYALENIGEISVIYNDKVIVFGGYIEGIPFWESPDNDETFKVQLNEVYADEYDIVYSN